MIRATVDANVLISHLLKPKADGPPNRVVRAAIAQEFELTLIETTLGEVANSIQSKPYLASRISKSSVAQLESALRLTATVVTESIERVPALTRDPGDDYLLAHAVLLNLEILVSGDLDLLVLGTFEGIRIVSPAEFVELLDRRE